MATLVINLTSSSEEATDSLAAFPLLEGQSEITSSYGDAVVVEYDLGERETTTLAQEQFLDTNRFVVGYEVRDGDDEPMPSDEFMEALAEEVLNRPALAGDYGYYGE